VTGEEKRKRKNLAARVFLLYKLEVGKGIFLYGDYIMRKEKEKKSNY